MIERNDELTLTPKHFLIRQIGGEGGDIVIANAGTTVFNAKDR